MTRVRVRAWCGVWPLVVGAPATAVARQDRRRRRRRSGTGSGTPPSRPAPSRDLVFDMGEIVVIGSPEGLPGVGGSLLTRDQMWTFDRNSLDQAVNVVPGVVSTFDSNGRRNESDIFVRGFGRWQVPLMLDGVRIYLPADNRLDFSRFLTADIAEVQIQKGYASVLDGPGAMGGAINLVTRKPTKTFEAEASGGFGGRSDNEGWNGYAMAGTRQPKYYLQGSVNYADRNFWTLSGDYQPRAGSLQPSGRRLSSDSADSRLNLKAGFTPNATDEYTFNYIKQEGEKGAPLNVNNNPPVPPEQLLAMAVLGRPEHVVPDQDAAGSGVLRQDQAVLQHLRERSRRVRRRHLHDAVGERTIPQSVRRSRLRRRRRARHDARVVEHAQGRRLLPDGLPYRAADQPADPPDAELDRARAGAIAEHLVDRRRGYVPRDAHGGYRRWRQLRQVPHHQGRGVQRDPGHLRVSEGRLGCVQLAERDRLALQPGGARSTRASPIGRGSR